MGDTLIFLSHFFQLDFFFFFFFLGGGGGIERVNIFLEIAYEDFSGYYWE